MKLKKYPAKRRQTQHTRNINNNTLFKKGN